MTEFDDFTHRFVGMTKYLGKLIVIGTVVIVLLLATALYFIYQNARAVRTQVHRDFQEKELILARNAARQIREQADNIVRDIEWMTQVEAKALAEGHYEQVLELLSSHCSLEDVLELGLTDDSGGILARRQSRHLPAQLPDKPFPSGSVPGKSQSRFQPLQMHRFTPDSAIAVATVSQRLTLQSGKELILFLRLDITGLVARIVDQHNQGLVSYAWVADKTGTVIYHPRRELVGRKAYSLSGKGSFEILSPPTEKGFIERLLSGDEGYGCYICGWKEAVDPCQKLVGFAPVGSEVLSPDQGWIVAFSTPTDDVAVAMLGQYERYAAIGGVIIAATFVIGLLGVIYQRRISRSLQEQVSRQRSFLSGVLQNSLDAIIFIDSNNRVLKWNIGAVNTFGYTAEEMLGKTFHVLIPPELDAETELERVRQEVNRKGFLRNYVSDRMTKDGRRITIDLSRTLIRSEDGTILGSAAIIKDITEKMELDQRIYNAEKLASIGTLAAGVAHEINNPLTIILGFADLLKEKFEPGSPELDDLKMIEENANHARTIIENLLGFARISESKVDSFNISHGLDRVINMMRHTLETSNIELIVNIPKNMPRVRGDTREFQQIIFNLIINSIAAMKKTKGGELTLSASVAGEWIEVSVTDTGIGIPQRIRHEIFDPFFTTKKVGEGTGLGLSLCYGIIKKYGGRITFTSSSKEDQPDVPTGTTFTISLREADSQLSGEEKDK